MATPKTKPKRKAKTSPVITIPVELMESQAFNSLNSVAIRVLLRFLRKRQLQKIKNSRRDQWTITNNGEIEYSYAEAESQGIFRGQFRQAIETLVDRGFISVAVEGGLMCRIALYKVHCPDAKEPWRKWQKPKAKKTQRSRGKDGKWKIKKGP